MQFKVVIFGVFIYRVVELIFDLDLLAMKMFFEVLKLGYELTIRDLRSLI